MPSIMPNYDAYLSLQASSSFIISCTHRSSSWVPWLAELSPARLATPFWPQQPSLPSCWLHGPTTHTPVTTPLTPMAQLVKQLQADLLNAPKINPGSGKPLWATLSATASNAGGGGLSGNRCRALFGQYCATCSPGFKACVACMTPSQTGGV